MALPTVSRATAWEETDCSFLDKNAVALQYRYIQHSFTTIYYASNTEYLYSLTPPSTHWYFVITVPGKKVLKGAEL